MDTRVTEADISAVYRLLLGREADPVGMSHFLGLAANGLQVADLAREFMDSTEYGERHGSPRSDDGCIRIGDIDAERLANHLMPHVLQQLKEEKPWRNNVFVPSPQVYSRPVDAPFMHYSTCSGSDFLHPCFSEIIASIGLHNEMHRKLWEWVFVAHHLVKSGVVMPGRRGLVFGVGKELLPSLFASRGVFVTATDAPMDIGVGSGWQGSNQHAYGLAAMPEGKLDRAEFERLVEWRECDMNAIASDLSGYDFCWSSCCFEHLGSLRHGMDFVLNSVENTLLPGGIAVHTTEFNLTSNDATVERGDTCFYRHRDIAELIAELRGRGHDVEPFRLAPDSLIVDGYVDAPPYRGPHLKLASEGFVVTSVGLVIRRRSGP